MPHRLAFRARFSVATRWPKHSTIAVCHVLPVLPGCTGAGSGCTDFEPQHAREPEELVFCSDDTASKGPNILGFVSDR